MFREGPQEISLVKLDPSGQVKINNSSSNGPEADNQGSNFETVRGDVLVKGGKWYYEVKLSTNGRIHIGWCTPKCQISSSSFSGLGQDTASWSYDGSSQKAWFGSPSGSTRYGEYWSVGDIIGTVLDLEAKTISFYRNGNDMGVAFTSVDGEGFYPAASIHKRQKVNFNFGKQPFKYDITQIFPDIHPLQLKLTKDQYIAVGKLFDKYKAISINVSESSENEDVIRGEGLLQYGRDLSITEDSDPGLMIIAWKCNVNHQKSWEMTREEFVGGWALHGCHTIDSMKKKLKEWKEEIKQPNKFRQFYYYVFDYLREDKKSLSIEECVTLWQILGVDKRWPLWPKWLQYLESKKAISRDVWRLFINFMEQYPKDLTNYDADGCWPSVIDEFVDWFKERK